MTKLELLKKEFIDLRDDVYRELIGNLYPSTVYKSLMEIRREYIAEGGNSHDLPYTPAPCFYGYAPSFEPVKHRKHA